ncbi:MAG: hypothetical protein SGJ27_18470, partial [Candidatus Melainabacteria bacterium]|nr:hypothetical protein [Candidatus Melainabacteria bacterium]
AFGVWRLAFGVWRLAFGVLRSTFCVLPPQFFGQTTCFYFGTVFGFTCGIRPCDSGPLVSRENA